jgi:RNA polymerase sigma-70 factor (ECF subfamily)
MTPKQTGANQAQLTAAHKDYSKSLNSHAYYKTGNHSMGENLVQDTFMKTWSYLLKGGKIDTMKAFLYHILNNLIVDEYRKRKTLSLDELIEEGYEPRVEDPKRLLDILDGKRALILIERLPESYCKVMRMRYVQCLSLEEMSQVTGKTKNSLAVLTHRGLEKLKVLYSPD